MDFIATTLGLQLPTLKARGCLQARRSCGLPDSNEPKIVWGCDQDLWDVPDKTECSYDDETASTLSDSDNSFSSSSDSLSPCVSFASPLVTDVFIRPYTDRREKDDLYYNESDYRQFRMDYRQSLCRKRPSVTFSSCIVSHVRVLPVVENKHEVYYSSGELKQ